jgi:hypothetical protein
VTFASAEAVKLVLQVCFNINDISYKLFGYKLDSSFDVLLHNSRLTKNQPSESETEEFQ